MPSTRMTVERHYEEEEEEEEEEEVIAPLVAEWLN